MPSVLNRVKNRLKEKAGEIAEQRREDKAYKQQIQKKAKAAYYQGYEKEAVAQARKRGHAAAKQPSGIVGVLGKVSSASNQLNAGFKMMDTDFGLGLPGAPSKPKVKHKTTKSGGTTIKVNGTVIHVKSGSKAGKKKKKPKSHQYDPLGMF